MILIRGLSVQALEATFFNRVSQGAVADGDASRFLAQSILTSDALFDTHGIPGEVIVDQNPAKLAVGVFSIHLR